MKISILLVFVVIGALFTLGVVYGRMVTRNLSPDRDKIVQRHRFVMRFTLWLVITGVALIEILIHTFPNIDRHITSTLFKVHMTFAVPFLLLLIAIQWRLDGLKNPKWHRKLTYICLIAFAGTFVTGFFLILAL